MSWARFVFVRAAQLSLSGKPYLFSLPLFGAYLLLLNWAARLSLLAKPLFLRWVDFPFRLVCLGVFSTGELFLLPFVSFCVWSMWLDFLT